MNRRIGSFLLVIGAVILVSGCSVNRATARLTPGADLSKVSDIYVVTEAGDDHAIDEMMKAQLHKMGYTAANGPEMPLPYKADAVLTYVDKWMWDITMYMLELTVEVRDPRDNRTLAVGNSYHTSLSRKTPEAMVEEVLVNIFRNAKQEGATK